MRNVASLATTAGAAAVFALFSTGCASFVPFTYELRAGHHLTGEEVKNLQFYSSHEIKLRREVQSEDRQITPGHKLRLVSGKSVEEVVIPAKTPGVAMRVSPQAISVSFVTGTSLDFVLGGARVSLGSFGEFVQPFAVAEGSYRPRPTPSPALLGQQYAQPPNPFPGPVHVAGSGSRPDTSLDGLGGNYFLAVDSGGQIPFAGLTWEAIDETSRAHLLINSDKLEETEEKRTVLPGVRLDN